MSLRRAPEKYITGAALDRADLDRLYERLYWIWSIKRIIEKTAFIFCMERRVRSDMKSPT
jgi:hypothetical protein